MPSLRATEVGWQLLRHRSSAWGQRWTLLPHEDPPDWFLDGSTSAGEQCEAISEATRARCPKASVVRLHVDVLNGHGNQTDPMSADVCGGHFGVHRRGKALRMATPTPGYVV
jgi:hypothetical protein